MGFEIRTGVLREHAAQVEAIFALVEGDHQFHRVDPIENRPHGVKRLAGDEDGFDAGITHDIGDFVGGEHRVQGNDHRTQLEDPVIDGNPLPAIR